ncbi:signal peptidase I [Solimicrobium silvestre]|uniref:Signal peptidase I n=1 Tax=Solimicrobium silvestre TaxID=2099400 RepID=A0A2S9GY76_9BURK|nr:signal peptidase I [Solimicrobium silvestre]PRC92606.1 Signal peptidase I [Solimicrobium silvestre]
MNLQSILGNFALILFILTIFTGAIWFLDVFVLAKQRKAAADAALAEFDSRRAKLSAEGLKLETSNREELKATLLRQPAWVEYTGSFFPVILLVFCLRSFLYEPFKIPSSSMLPTLLVGDLILVNKFTYGIRLPILNKKIIEINQPQRGDVMVFKYPKDMSLDYIKRVIGVPGDKITYKNKRLTVNGQEVTYKELPDFLDEERLTYAKHYEENLTGVHHQILNDERAPTYVSGDHYFPQSELCSYDTEGFTCTVPKGHYFMMGDNRDNSADSRYWGFVPDENIVGKAFGIWMNQNVITNFDFSKLKRIGSFQ